MTAPVTEQPRPTLHRHRPRAARGLAVTAAYCLLAALFGTASAWLLHHHHLAVLIAVAGVGAAAVNGAAAVVVAARTLAFNPAPAVLAAVLAAAVAAWALLPAAGLSWLRVPAMIGAALLAVRAVKWWRKNHLRRCEHHRWAQALEPFVSTVKSQAEQIAAGLTGMVDRDRITEPHLGVAPHAAWQLRITVWDGPRIRQAKLKLPWCPDIRNPDLLIKIREALKVRAGVEHLRLSTEPFLDEITIDVLDGPGEEVAAAADVTELAVERATSVAGMILKGARVTAEDVDVSEAQVTEGGGTAGAGHALKAFSVKYDPTKIVTSSGNRAAITEHVSTQLYGVPDRLRADWHVDQDLVAFQRRRDFPDRIPHTALDLSEAYPGQIVLPFAEDEDGGLVTYPLYPTPLPHGLVIGKTGGGKTVLLVTLAIEAARQGIEVWGADPKRIELMGLRGWPNVTKIATRVADMVKLVEDFDTEMQRRYALIETGRARAKDFRRLLLILDEYFVFGMFVNDWWSKTRTKEDPKVHPVFGKIAQIAAMSRSAGMHMVIGVQRPDAAFFVDGARDNFGFRVSLGPLSQQAAQMLWGDAHVGTDVPAVQGLCTATAPGGPVRAKVHFTPNPAEALTGDLSDEDLEILRSLLPPGTSWDGPLLPEDADPGFEAAAAAAAADTGDADPVTVFLSMVRGALHTGTHHLTDGTSGGPPVTGNRGLYGWRLSASGRPEPSGKWIGCASVTSDGGRVFLYPQRAFEAAGSFAAELGVPFRYTKDRLEAALRKSGLLVTEQTKDDGERGTVRRMVPGNDLGLRDDRQRVWDLPEDAVLGEVPGLEPRQDNAQPAPAPEPQPGSGPVDDTAGPGGLFPDLADPDIDPGQDLDDVAGPPAAGGAHSDTGPAVTYEWSPAGDLREGDRIVLPDWVEPGLPAPVVAIVVQDPAPHPAQPGHVVLDYWVGQEPRATILRAGEPIYFADDQLSE